MLSFKKWVSRSDLFLYEGQRKLKVSATDGLVEAEEDFLEEVTLVQGFLTLCTTDIQAG